MSNSLPAGLLIDAVLKQCDTDFIPYYIVQKGNHGSGVIMVKLNYLDGTSRLETQQRNFMTDEMEWISVFDEDKSDETKIDEYIARAKPRDPDLWVIEIECRSNTDNPFKV